MLEINIPGLKIIRIENLVLDYNGTIALDGKLLPGVKERLTKLSEKLSIYVITADTFGTAKENCAGLNLQYLKLNNLKGSEEKEQHILKLKKEFTAAIGNGYNDYLMLKQAELGIIVIEKEGAAVRSLLSADIAVNSIIDALDLLLNPKRLVATIRV